MPRSDPAPPIVAETLDEQTAPPGALVVVTWHDIHASVNGDPDDAELFARQSVGFVHAYRMEHGCPPFVVLRMDRAMDGDDSESGWCAIPLAVIAEWQVLGMLERVREQ